MSQGTALGSGRLCQRQQILRRPLRPRLIGIPAPEGSIGILRLVVVADRDTDAEAAARSAHQVWFRSITQLWHEHDDHSIDGLFSWETAIQHKRIIFGSPDRVRGEMQRVATESGCNYVVCSFAWGTLSREQSMRSLDLFASDVMPACCGP